MATFLVRVLELPANLEDGQVTGEKIAEEAVGTVQLADSGVLGDDIAQNTIYGGNIEDNSIHSADIHDGTITGADTDGGFWHPVTRGNLYVRSEQRTLTTKGSSATATVRCDNVDDIPVSGGCSVSITAAVVPTNFAPVDWGAVTVPGGYSCSYQSNSESDVTFAALVHCLDVAP